MSPDPVENQRANPDPMSDPIQPVGNWNVANLLTMTRMLLVPVFVLLYLADGDAARTAAAVVFALAALTDFVDGTVARRRGLVTTFGKVADPLADKALTGAALIALSGSHELAWWVTVTILSRELIVTALRFWVIEHGVIAASHGGKAKTVLQLTAIELYLLPLDGTLSSARGYVMALALGVTLVTGVDYVVQARRLRRTVVAAPG